MLIALMGAVVSCGGELRPLTQVGKPKFSPPPGKYSHAVTVNISVEEPNGATINYSTDGTDPRRIEMEFDEPLDINTSTRFRAFGWMPRFADSRVVEALYDIDIPPPPPPPPPPGLCDPPWEWMCENGNGNMSDFNDPMYVRFNHDFVAVPPEFSWCPGRMWLQDKAGKKNDAIWLCQPDPYQPYAYMQDETGRVIREAWYQRCSCERSGDLHGQEAIEWCTTHHPVASPPPSDCAWLLRQTAGRPGGGVGFWEVHDLLKGTTTNYFRSKENAGP